MRHPCQIKPQQKETFFKTLIPHINKPSKKNHLQNVTVYVTTSQHINVSPMQ